MKKTVLTLLSTLGWGITAPQAQEPPTPGELGVVADHHLHLRTAMDIEAMVEFNRNAPEDLRDPSISEDMPVVSARDLIAQLDRAGIKYGTVLSSAYLFGMPEYQAGDEERRSKTRHLNDLVARETAQFPERLRAFCGVNPLDGFAREEVTRCAEELGMAGVKVHFANSDVDLSSPDHLERLREFFAHVTELGLPVALHLRTRNPEFGRADVSSFIQNVVVDVPGVELYIAHLSGWGGYDANTHEALTAWADAFESGEIAEPGKIRFDLAATVTRHPREEYAQIAEIVRRLGAARVFVGSDWPAFNQPRWVAVNFRNNVPLSEAEHRTILENLAPYFER